MRTNGRCRRSPGARAGPRAGDGHAAGRGRSPGRHRPPRGDGGVEQGGRLVSVVRHQRADLGGATAGAGDDEAAAVVGLPSLGPRPRQEAGEQEAAIEAGRGAIEGEQGVEVDEAGRADIATGGVGVPKGQRRPRRDAPGAGDAAAPSGRSRSRRRSRGADRRRRRPASRPAPARCPRRAGGRRNRRAAGSPVRDAARPRPPAPSRSSRGRGRRAGPRRSRPSGRRRRADRSSGRGG